MQDLLDSQSKAATAISDHNGRPQDRRKATQKRTFTRWMNVFLQKRNPPLAVSDLFTDIQDGRMLMALLEELSGCKLLYRYRSSSHRIFRLNNISKALAFLDDRHVKLLGIDASGIADGLPSVVLNLVWNIILHFQVKEATGGLQRHLSSSLSSLSLSAYPSTSDLSPQTCDNGSYSCNTLPRKGKKAEREPKYHSQAIKTLLHWVQRCTSKYGVDVDDFGASWRSGMAFLALIKSINPDLVNLRESLSKEPKENLRQAFMLAHQCLDVPPLLEPEDVACASPDEQSIITYVSMFLGDHSVTDEGHMAQFDFHEIPSFASREPVGLGQTLADHPEARALLRTFEKSDEQRLWRQWSRKSSETSRAHNSNMSGSPETSFPFTQRALEPPSPLEAGIANQDIRSWMDKSSDRGYGKRSYVSQSSEEGIYSLSALDSDEEDAYSYILDLNKDVFRPSNPSKRQVPKVEEETAEEMEEESKHLAALGMFNGGGHKQEGHLRANRKLDLDKIKSILRETTNKRAVFDLEPEAQRGTNRDTYTEKESNRRMESDGKEKDGFDKVQDGGVKATIFEVASWKYAEEGGAELSGKLGLASERTVEEDLGRLKEGQDLKEPSESEEARVEKKDTGSQKRGKLQSFNEKTAGKMSSEDAGFNILNTNGATISNTGCGAEVKMKEAGHLMKSSDYGFVQTEDWRKREPAISRLEDLKADQRTTPESLPDDVHEGDNSRTVACRESSQSLWNNGELSLQSIAACCNSTPLELEVLLLLWISLYCYLILPQMYL
ncbi:dystrophin isoform X1 [Xiphophorus hellerii]|uniref:dystrophin isoform X1 n=1 Tax=Xiphophorus hellerii TaxID=8084 RepID=UPI0013B357FE|nr:dystrophin-like isoform X1 [Xiphophorus hellerii]